MRAANMDAPPALEEKRKYTVADFEWLARLPEYADCRFEMHEGELVKMEPAGLWHSNRSVRISRLLDEYAERTGSGMVTSDGGHYSVEDDETLLAPDAAFTRMERLSDPELHAFVPVMPDLAVEVKSPRDSYAFMRRKTLLYLERGTTIVWLVYPERREVEVCALDADGDMTSEFVGEDDELSGGDVLPGFTLTLSRLFYQAGS